MGKVREPGFNSLLHSRLGPPGRPYHDTVMLMCWESPALRQDLCRRLQKRAGVRECVHAHVGWVWVFASRALPGMHRLHPSTT